MIRKFGRISRGLGSVQACRLLTQASLGADGSGVSRGMGQVKRACMSPICSESAKCYRVARMARVSTN